MNNRLLNIFSFTVILAMAFAAFSVTGPGGFLSDDFTLLGNVIAVNLSNFWRSVILPDVSWGFYRPIGTLYWIFCYKLFGTDPFGYWIFSVLVHSVNGFLIFLIAKRLDFQYLGALSASLIFAAFPLHGESVAWLSCGFDRLCLLFMLCGIYAYLNYLKIRRPYVFFLVIAFFALALFSKEMAITFPALLFLIDTLKEKKPKSSFVRILPFIALAIVYLSFRYMVFHGMGGYTEHGKSIQTTFDLDVISYNIKHIPGLLFFPINAFSMRDTRFIMATIAAIVALATVTRAVFGGGWKFTLFGLGWLVIAYSPAMTLYAALPNLMGGRFSYVPSVGFAFLAGSLFNLSNSPTRSENILKTGLLAALLGCYLYVCMFNYSSWAVAYDVARFIPREVVKLVPCPPQGSDFYFIGAYDNFRGAYIFRNGLEEAVNIQYGLKEEKHIKAKFIDPDGRVRDQPSLDYRTLVRSRRDNLFIFLFQNKTGKMLLLYQRPYHG